ncbi:HEPN domain-containing protein [Methanopyrus sp.]
MGSTPSRGWLRRLRKAARRVLGEDARVVPFGSFARGRAVPGSDLDVMVVSEHAPSSFKERVWIAHELCKEAGLPEESVDLLVMRPEEFEVWGRVLTSSESDDTRALVEELLERGERFLKSAAEFEGRGWDDLAALHAHQAVEMTVKAALLALGEPPPRTHLLGKLLGELYRVTGDDTFRELSRRYRWELRELSHAWFEARYGRYPGEDIDVGELVEVARDIVETVHGYVSKLIGTREEG